MPMLVVAALRRAGGHQGAAKATRARALQDPGGVGPGASGERKEGHRIVYLSHFFSGS